MLVKSPKMKAHRQDAAERQCLRHVVVIDAPSAPLVPEPPEDARLAEGKFVSVIVGIAAGRASVDEEAVGPCLTRG
jgi:hypothetical protein